MGSLEGLRGEEIRDPFIFVYDGRRYAVQGAGQLPGRARLLLYGCDNLRRWSELGCLLGADDPIAAKLAPADMWECPNLVRIDGQWVIVLAVASGRWPQPAGWCVRYLLGDLTAQGHGLRFRRHPEAWSTTVPRSTLPSCWPTGSHAAVGLGLGTRPQRRADRGGRLGRRTDVPA